MKLKIVQIIPELNLKIMGGIGRFVQTLLHFIDKEKSKNIIVTYKSDPQDRIYYESLGIPVFSLLENTNLPEKSAIETTQWLITILKKIQPDIVMTHSFWGSTLGVKAAYKAQIPLILIRDDNIDLDDSKQQKRVKKNILKFTDCVVCVGNSVKNYANRIEQIPLTKLRLIYNGIHLDNYPFKYIDRRAKEKDVFVFEPNLKNNSSIKLNDRQSKVNNFVFIARLEPQKVPSRVINAISSLRQKGYNCQLSIIGDGSLKTECEKQIKQLQSTDKIKLLGYRNKPWQCIDRDSIFIMTSDFEGHPQAVLEAMASGHLCVLPDLKPVLDIVENSPIAIIYQAGNQQDLENKIEFAINLSLVEKQLIIDRARKKVEEEFNAQIMAQNYLNLYQELFWLKSANKLIKEGALNKAISAYRKVLKFNPNSAYSYQNLAEILARKGWRKEAVNFYMRAWLCNPSEVKYWHDNYLPTTKNSDRIQKKSIFIVGCGHSGTTLMLRLLAAHPLLYAISYESLIFTKSDLEIQEKLKEWDKICQKNDRNIWLEKTPEHIYTIGKIFSHCPNSKIIWMVRDFRDVISSQIKANLKKFSFEDLTNELIARIIAGTKFLNDTRVKLVKYEDIITQTQKTLIDVFNFIEEDYVEEILNYHQKPFYVMNQDTLKKPWNTNEKQYTSQLRNWQVNQPIFDGRGCWQKEMTLQQKEIFKQKAQEYLVKFGYANNDQW